jgi:CcmD family protein
MSDWGWVTAAYVAVYGTLAVYAVSLGRRLRRARRSLQAR